ncbi:hypothetical protein EOPP23_06715 [Endozoicomonas sp. OPT23]|uniref:hypothetical protein n=1 Tax=Endozoicomonas sp. OPT23 TaxID=2072845 RepID=UPI00129A933C|nr:hypothetical protein [Endozoicomonas sp. OPT23]MRI32679.1 hypothetical protein [Endozoicomonas sp. OPT23]
MSALKKKLLKSCCKTTDKPKPKVGKKLLAHELELSDILPLINILADSDEKQRHALNGLIDLLAPDADDKIRQSLETHLVQLGFAEASTKKPELKLVSDSPIATRPYKEKPCSSCPALKNGLCRCALKKAQAMH